MRLEQLQYLIEMNRTGTMHKAGENLFISQPAISMGLKKLEEELKINIFDRKKSGLVPTPIGNLIINEAENILAHIMHIYRLSKHEQAATVTDIQDLAVYCEYPLSSSILPIILPTVHHFFPTIKISTTEQKSGKDVIKSVEKNGAAMGFVYHDGKTSLNPTIDWHYMCKCDAYIIGAEHFLPWSVDQITVDHIKKLPIVIRSMPVMKKILPDFSKEKYNIIIEAAGTDIRNAYVEKGIACAVIYKFGNMIPCKPVAANLRMIPLEPISDVELYMCAGKEFSANMAHFIVSFLTQDIT